MKPAQTFGSFDLASSDMVIRPASKTDQDDLERLLNTSNHVHRHLDWRSALDWLGYQPFWVLQKNQRLLAALACLPDPPEVAWVRLFAAADSIDPFEAWLALWGKIRQNDSLTLSGQIVALALQKWFEGVLVQSGFNQHQTIVVLVWKSRRTILERPLPASVSLRPMSINDLEEVQKLDEIAFDPLWRISLSAMRNAFQQSAYATVAQSGGKIIGYQLSTSTPYSAHLARLAVHPQQQRQNIGHALVQDFLQFTRANDLWRVTVNTQSDNYASLALYAQVGFGTTNENFPVFTLNWK